MDHPEQALFEEVKGLKTQMEEVRDRIFKIENTYINKVENIERRDYISSNIDIKIEQYKQNLKTKKTIVLDGKQIPLFKDTVFLNIYKSSKLMKLWDSEVSEVIYDMDYDYFMAVMDVIKRGHNFEMLDEEDKNSIQRNFKLRSKELEKDDVFGELLRSFFEGEGFSAVVMDYSLNYSYYPKDLKDIIANVRYADVNFNMSHVKKYEILENKSSSELTNIKNKTAIFLDYNKSCTVELKECVRVKCIGLKPFTDDTSNFYPTTGCSYATISTSYNEKDWDSPTTFPSTYGNGENEYVSTINFPSYRTFKYIKFTTNSSAQVSVSYIKFL